MMKLVLFFFIMLSTIVNGQEHHLEIKNNKAGLSPLVSINNLDINSSSLYNYITTVESSQIKKQKKQHTFHPPKEAFTLSEYKQLIKINLNTISNKRVGKKNDY